MCFQLVSGNDFYLYCAQPSTLPEKLFLTHFEKSVVQVEILSAGQEDPPSCEACRCHWSHCLLHSGCRRRCDAESRDSGRTRQRWRLESVMFRTKYMLTYTHKCMLLSHGLFLFSAILERQRQTRTMTSKKHM